MAKKDAINLINRSNEAFDTAEQKVLRKLMDIVYADVGAAVDDLVIVSADANNDITAGSDGGAFYDAVP